MISRRRKILLILLLTPLLLLGGLALFVRWRYPPERVRALALEWIGKTLRREVRLEKVRLGWTGAELTGLDLRERAGFPEGSFFSARRLFVQPNLLFLLSGRLVIRSLTLEDPRAVIHRRADGVLNIGDFLSAPPPPAERKTPAVEPSRAAFYIRRVFLRGGAIRWTDAVRGDDLRAEKISLSLTGFSLATPFDLRLSAEGSGRTGGRDLHGRVALAARVNLPAQELRLDDARVSLGKSAVTLAGTLRSFAAPALHLTLGLTPLSADTLAPFVDIPPDFRGGSVQGSLKIDGTPDRLRVAGPLTLAAAGVSTVVTLSATVTLPAFDVSLTPERLNVQQSPWLPDLAAAGALTGLLTVRGTPDRAVFSADLDGSGLELKKADLFAKAAGVPLRVNAGGVWTEAVTTLNALRLESPAGVMEAQGTLRGKDKTSALDAVLRAPAVDLAGATTLLPFLGATPAGGKIALDMQIQGRGNVLQVSGTAHPLDVSLTPVDGVTLKGVTGDLTFSSHDLNGPAGSPPLARLRGRLKIAEITHPHYTGRAFDIQHDLTNLGPDPARVNGTITFTAADGKIHGLPFTASINALAKKDLTDLTYKTMAGHLRVNQGTVFTEDVVVDSGQADIHARGRVRLSDTDADLFLTLLLPPGAVGGSAGEFMAGPDGRVTIPARITGPLTDPHSFRLDKSRTTKTAVKNLIRKGIEKIGTSAGDKTGDAPGGGTKQDAVNKAVEKGLKSLEKWLKKP